MEPHRTSDKHQEVHFKSSTQKQKQGISRGLFFILIYLLGVFPALLYAQNTLQNGLVSYWTFDEGSGSVVGDAHGNFDGTILGSGSVWASGKMGSGLNLASGNGYVRVTDNVALKPQELTLGVWVYRTGMYTWYTILGATNTSWNSGYGITNVNGSSEVYFWINNYTTSSSIVSFGELPLNTWTYLVATYDGETMRAFKNGQLSQELELNSGITYGMQHLQLGGVDGSYTFPGVIDEAAVWNRALTQEEITALYNVGNGLQYPFTSSESSEIFIYSGLTDGTVRKLDTFGNEVWSFARHENAVLSVAVDASNNVFSGSSDNTVRKLDTSGNEVWSFTGHTDAVQAIAVDASGNVYSGSFDNTIRKIDAFGNEVWSFTGHTDRVSAIAVDGDGNVYSGSFDTTVRKIDASGNEVWSFTGHASGVNAVAVDESGNVYSGSSDRTVRKINVSGNEVWSFSGHTDAVRAVAVDKYGNVYSGSNDLTVRKIDSSGNEVWSFTGHVNWINSVAVDDNGNVFSGSYDLSVRKIDASGNQVWTFFDHLNGVYAVAVTPAQIERIPAPLLSTPTNEATDISLQPEFTWQSVAEAESYTLQVSDSENFSNLIINETEIATESFTISANLDSETTYYWRVRGMDENGVNGNWSEVWSFTTQSDDLQDIFIYTSSGSRTLNKLNSQGNMLWELSDLSEIAHAVALDYDDNVILGTSGNNVRKFDSDGNQLWTYTGHTGRVYGVTADPYGNIYTGSWDNTVRKLDSGGNELWRFDGHTNYIWSLTSDVEGNVYTASWDNTVRKIDTDGNEIWTFTGHTDNVTDVAVDRQGNVYTVSWDNTVRKIDANGNEIWSFTGHTDILFAIAVDQDGNVYSAGDDRTVRKLDANGNQVWSFDGHTSRINELGVDELGFIYTASGDRSVRKLDTNGNEIWSFTNYSNSVLALAVTPAGVELLDAPLLSTPTNEATDISLQPEFTWQSVAEAESYALQVSDSENFSNIIINETEIATESFTVSANLDSETTYYWRVRGVDENGLNGNWSEVWSFTTTTEVAIFLYSGDTANLVRKYDLSGNQIWAYSGHTDWLRAVATDANGYVYSGGQDRTLRKLSPAGEEIWVVSLFTEAVLSIAVDEAGYVYVASADNRVRKFNANGALQWTYTGHTQIVWGVAVDHLGNVYSASDDRSVRKLDASGNLIWTYTGHETGVRSVAVDRSGFVYSGSNDGTVHKINQNGNQVWVYTGHSGSVRSVAVDSEGFVYSTSVDRTVHKVNSDGNQVWSFTGHTSTVWDVAVDQDGNVYTAGNDLSLRKINNSGNQLWSISTNTPLAVAVTPSLPVAVPSADLTFPITFNDPNVDYGVNAFGGASAAIVPDPTDESNNVVRKIKTAGSEPWAGVTIGETVGLAEPIPFDAQNTRMSVRVWSPVSNIPVRLKVEELHNPMRMVEIEAMVTAAGTWQTLTFDFSNQSSGSAPIDFSYNYDKISIFFDFGNQGEGQTFYFDDIQFLDGEFRDVVFTVDMRVQRSIGHFDPSVHDVKLKGSFLGWEVGDGALMNEIATDIYRTTVTIPGAEGSEVQYKFVYIDKGSNEIFWEAENTGPGVAGNRVLELGPAGEEMVLETVFFSNEEELPEFPFFEDFEMGSKVTYATQSLSLATGNWYFEEALLGRSIDDKRNGAQSVRLRIDGRIEMEFDTNFRSNRVSFKAAMFGSDTPAPLRMYYSLNSGSTWINAFETNQLSNSELQTFIVEIPENNRVRLRFVSSSDFMRHNIDDVAIYYHDGDEDPISDNIIINGNFEDGLNNWTTFAADFAGVTADFNVVNGQTAITNISGTGQEVWHLQLYQVFTPEQIEALEVGQNYKATFEARSSVNDRLLRFYFGQEGGEFVPVIVEDYFISTTMETYEVQFELTEKFSSMKFGMEVGLSTADAFIGNVTLKRVDPNELPGDVVAASTIKELLEIADIGSSTLYELTGNVVLFHKIGNRNTRVVVDETGGLLIDSDILMPNEEYEIGDMVTGLRGTVSDFNGLVQFRPIESPNFRRVARDIPIVPAVRTISEITNELISTPVFVRNATFLQGSGIFLDRVNYPIEDNTGSLPFRTNFTDTYNSGFAGNPIPSQPTNIFGYIGTFNEPQLQSLFYDNLYPSSAIPSFSLQSPANNAALEISGHISDELTLSWQSAGSGSPRYTLIAKKEEKEFYVPFFYFSSDQSGAANQLTFTYQELDEVLANLGLSVGESVTLHWKVKATTSNGMNFSNQVFTITLIRGEVTDTVAPIILEIPYAQDFDGATDEGWFSDGTNNSWQRGIPAQTQIDRASVGSNVWMTNLASNYANNMDGQLYTPIFDFSELETAPMLRFDQNFITENNWDGGVLEYTTDQGETWQRWDANIGQGPLFETELSYNWYNNNSSSGPQNPPKFSGNSRNYLLHQNSWIATQTLLSGLEGQALVQFRFRFRSDGSNNNEGWAIDNFRIYEPLPVVTLVSPEHEAVNVPAITALEWQAVDGAASYRIQILRGSEFIIEERGIIQTSYTYADALESQTTYRWRVQAEDADGQTNPWSNYFTFTTGTPVASWFPMRSISDRRLHGASYLNEDVVFAVGEQGTILRSDNGGSSWNAVFSGLTNQLNDVVMVADRSVGYIVGNGGRLLRSGNNGETWSTINVSTSNNLNAVDARASGRAAVVGNNGTIFRDETGDNWTPIFVSSASQLHSVSLPDESAIWIAGENGLVLYSIANSSSYTIVATPTSEHLYAIQFLTGNEGYVAGANGTLLRTTNGGTNWETITTGTYEIIRTIYFVDMQTGWIAGDNGLFYLTQDGGSSWESVPGSNQASIRTLAFGAEFSGVALGETNSAFRYGTFETIQIPQVSLVSPQNEETDVPLETDFVWENVPIAGAYRIQVSQSNNFESFVINQTTDSHEFTLSEPLEQGRVHYWRVQGLTEGLTAGPWSEVWSFTSFVLLPGQITLLSPDDEATLVSRRAEFVWQADENSSSYEVQIASSANFDTNSDSYVHTVTISDGTSYIIDENLPVFTDLYWRVRGRSGEFFGDWSSVRTFTVEISPNDDGWMNVSANTERNLNALTYINQDVLWIAGNNGTLLRSQDGGFNWDIRTLGIAQHLTALDFPSETRGYVAGENGQLFMTINGGTEWTALNSGISNTITSVAFTTPTTGVIGGAFGIRRTTNSGSTWAFTLSTGAVNDIHFADDQNGWAVGTNGSVWRTTNSGQSWTSVSGLPNQNLNSVYFLDADWGFVAGNNRTLYHTSDGGANWRAVTGLPLEDFSEVHFASYNQGWVAGSNGVLLYTNDGGQTWTTNNAGTTNQLRGISFFNPDLGVVISTSGGIYRFEDNQFTNVVTLFSPENEATEVQLSPRFRWNPAFEAARYRVQISTNAAFTQIIINEEVTATNYLVTTPLTGETTYYWRVRGVAFNSVNLPLSDVYSFTTEDGRTEINNIYVSYGPDGVFARHSDPITIRFTHAMQPESVAAALLIRDTAGQITYGFQLSASDGNRLFTIQPTGSLRASDNIRVNVDASQLQTVDPMLLIGAGNSLQFTFQTTLLADFNNDQTVNISDLTLFANRWRETTDIRLFDIAPATGTFPRLRPNADGVVDYEDLIVFARHWNASVGNQALSSASLAMNLPAEQLTDYLQDAYRRSFLSHHNVSNSEDLKAMPLHNRYVYTLESSGQPRSRAGHTSLTEELPEYRDRQADRVPLQQGVALQVSDLRSTYQQIGVQEIPRQRIAMVVTETDSLLAWQIRVGIPQGMRVSEFMASDVFDRRGGQSFILDGVSEDGRELTLTVANLGGAGAVQQGDTLAVLVLESDYEQAAPLRVSAELYRSPQDYAKRQVETELDFGLEIPELFALHQNYPNPFNPVTQIRYDLPEQAMVRIEVYDVLGRRVSVLQDARMAAGYYELSWDASRMASGVYVYVIRAQTESGKQYTQTRTMTLVK